MAAYFPHQEFPWSLKRHSILHVLLLTTTHGSFAQESLPGRRESSCPRVVRSQGEVLIEMNTSNRCTLALLTKNDWTEVLNSWVEVRHRYCAPERQVRAVGSRKSSGDLLDLHLNTPSAGFLDGAWWDSVSVLMWEIPEQVQNNPRFWFREVEIHQDIRGQYLWEFHCMSI